jgi:predicted metalloprotease
MSLNMMLEWLVRVLNVDVSVRRVVPIQPVPTPQRLATLTKTALFAHNEPPDRAIPILQNLSGELRAAADAMTRAGVELAADALALSRQVAADLAAAPARALEVAQTHVAAWLDEVAALPPAARPADAPVDPKARAALLLPLINKLGTGIPEDEAMLARIKLKSDPMFAPAKSALATLREEYATLLPKRTEGVEPSAPLVAVTRPQLGAGGESPKLKENLGLIETAMANNLAPDPKLLDAVVAEIRSKIDLVSAEAEMRRLKTWDAVKADYKRLSQGDGPTGKAFMSKMWWFRRQTVDGQMTALQKLYGFAWGSVGSANPESDYDVTVRTHGTKADAVYYDYQIVADFNKAVSTPFGGTAPGILFDTNLYAEAPVALPAGPATPTTRAMSAMTEQGQDVGALMKLRRYMDWGDYTAYQEQTLAALPKEQRALTLRQFEEADALYFIARAEQLQQAGIRVDDVPNTLAGQKILEERAVALEHDGAKSMATNNALYLAKMEQVRKLEKALLAERDGDKKAALLAKLRTLQADATFFAAEAYHSEGPLKHVVEAVQSSKAAVNGAQYAAFTPQQKTAKIKELKDKKLEGYSAMQMLQSLNENLGDLLKDLRHYESEPFPGLGFYRSSKYLKRVCDAAILTGSKLPADSKLKFDALRIGGKTPAAVQMAVAGMVDIRGEAKVFDVADPEQEKQAYAIEEMAKIFPGVTTLRDLGKIVAAFGQQVNAVARAVVTDQLRATDEAAYFRATG